MWYQNLHWDKKQSFYVTRSFLIITTELMKSFALLNICYLLKMTSVNSDCKVNTMLHFFKRIHDGKNGCDLVSLIMHRKQAANMQSCESDYHTWTVAHWRRVRTWLSRSLFSMPLSSDMVFTIVSRWPVNKSLNERTIWNDN